MKMRLSETKSVYECPRCGYTEIVDEGEQPPEACERCRSAIIDAFWYCHTREDVDAVWSKYDITDTQGKLDALNEVMGNPMTWWTGPADEIAKLTPEDFLHRTVSMFLVGTWKINEIYKRAGFES